MPGPRNQIPCDRVRSASTDSARFIVVFRETDQNRVVKRIRMHGGSRSAEFSQAQTTPDDAAQLIARLQLEGARARQLTPSMHVLQFEAPLSGAAVGAGAQAPARRCPGRARRRGPAALPARRANDPLFAPSSRAPAASGSCSVPRAGDAAAVDAVEAWDLTTGQHRHRHRGRRLRLPLRPSGPAAGRPRRQAAAGLRLRQRGSGQHRRSFTRHLPDRQRRRWLGPGPVRSGRLDQRERSVEQSVSRARAARSRPAHGTARAWRACSARSPTTAPALPA